MTANFSPKIEKQADNSIKINLTIPKEAIKKEYEHHFGHLQESLTVKGFRPGKIPADVAKQKLPENEILQQAISAIISNSYRQIITDKKLKPVVNPRIKLTNVPSLNSDCQVEIVTTELPVATLAKDYITKIKKSNDKFASLIELTDTQIPKILLESEVEIRLRQLLSDLANSKLSLVDYLQQMGLDLRGLQTKLETASTEEITLQLALNQIATDQKIDIKDTVDFVRNLKN